MTLIQSKTNKATLTFHGQTYLHNKWVTGRLWDLVKALQRVLSEGRTASLSWYSKKKGRYYRNALANTITVLKRDGRLYPLRGFVNGEQLPELTPDEVVDFYAEDTEGAAA